MRSVTVLCSLLLLSFTACSEEFSTAEPGPASSGILTFRDSTAIFAYTEKDAAPAFRSMEQLYQEALGKLDAVTTLDEEQRILQEYRDVVYQADDAYHPVIENPLYRRIINRDRMYISDSSLHKVIDNNYIVFTGVEHRDELRDIESIDHLDLKIFKAARYHGSEPTSPHSKLTSCGNQLQKDHFRNGSNCRNDRRAWIRAYTSFIVSGYYFTPAVISEAWAELRTGTFCKWKQYQNTLYTRNAYFTVTARLNDTTYSFTKTTTDLADSNPYNGTSSEWQHFIWGGEDGMHAVGSAIYWGGGVYPSIEFTNIHMESSSQGVGADQDDHWAVIDCQ